MLRLYVFLFIVAILSGVGYGAYYYYNDTQKRIATLRENNAKLEVAVDTAQESIETLQGNVTKLANLNKGLQESLQKAEAYGDELRAKLSNLDLVVEAFKNSKVLEGKMNGATANLWRDFMGDTGNVNDRPLPNWLQQPPLRTGDQNDNQVGEGSDTSSSTTEATSTE